MLSAHHRERRSRRPASRQRCCHGGPDEVTTRDLTVSKPLPADLRRDREVGARVTRRRVRPYQALDLARRRARNRDAPRGAAELERGRLARSVWVCIAIPIVMLVSLFPLVLLRPGGDVEIGFDAAVLVGLGVVLPHAQRSFIWSIAGILSQVLSRPNGSGLGCSTSGWSSSSAGSTLGHDEPYRRPR